MSYKHSLLYAWPLCFIQKLPVYVPGNLLLLRTNHQYHHRSKWIQSFFSCVQAQQHPRYGKNASIYTGRNKSITDRIAFHEFVGGRQTNDIHFSLYMGNGSSRLDTFHSRNLGREIHFFYQPRNWIYYFFDNSLPFMSGLSSRFTPWVLLYWPTPLRPIYIPPLSSSLAGSARSWFYFEI